MKTMYGSWERPRAASNLISFTHTWSIKQNKSCFYRNIVAASYDCKNVIWSQLFDYLGIENVVNLGMKIGTLRSRFYFLIVRNCQYSPHNYLLRRGFSPQHHPIPSISFSWEFGTSSITWAHEKRHLGVLARWLPLVDEGHVRGWGAGPSGSRAGVGVDDTR